MIKQWLKFLILLAAVSWGAFLAYGKEAEIPASYETEILAVPQEGYRAVRITPDIFKKAHSSLRDLRIVDEAGEAVPYFINNGTESDDTVETTYETRLINEFVKDRNYYLDYEIIREDTQTDVLTGGFLIRMGQGDFAKKATVSGSYDNIRWEEITADSIYALGQVQKDEIVLESPQKYTYYRFRLNDDSEKIIPRSVTPFYNARSEKYIAFTQVIRPVFTVEADPLEKTNTQITIPNEEIKNLPISKITMETADMFSRTVRVGEHVTRLYNLTFQEVSLRNTDIDLGGRVFNGDLVILVENHDDKPLNIEGIQLEYLTCDVVFKGEPNQTLWLSYGNLENQKPVYDIENYKRYILQEGYQYAELGAARDVYGPFLSTEKPPFDYRLIFNIAVILAAMGVLFLIVGAVKKQK